MKNALWPQVKRAYPVTLAGSGDPLCLQLPHQLIPGHKAYPASPSHPGPSKTQRDSNKTSVPDRHPRPAGLQRLESTFGVIRLQDPTQDRANVHQVPQPGWGTAFVQRQHRQGPWAMSVSSSVLLPTICCFLASLPVFWARPLVYSAAFSKGVAWTGRLPQPPSVLRCSTGVCFLLCPSCIIVLGMRTERDPLCVRSS